MNSPNKKKNSTNPVDAIAGELSSVLMQVMNKLVELITLCIKSGVEALVVKKKQPAGKFRIEIKKEFKK